MNITLRVPGATVRDFCKMQVHRVNIAGRQDKSRALAQGRADRFKDVGRCGSLIMCCRWTCSALCPPTRHLVFLTHAGLVLKPDFYCGALREACTSFCQFGCTPPLFKRPQRLCVLSMVARPRYQLDITVLVQHPIHGRFVKRDCEFLIEPLCQVDQPPATTPWISGIGPLSTIALSASRWASMSLGRLPVALPLISP